MQTPRLVKSSDIPSDSPSDLGRLKTTSSTYQLETTRSTLHQDLDRILDHFRLNHLNGTLKLNMYFGGVGGVELEYQETHRP